MKVNVQTLRESTPQRLAFLAGAVGMAIAILAWIASAVGWIDSAHFYRAYLFSWLFCLGIANGSLVLVMMHNLTGGRWGWLIRRIAEAASLTLPLLILLYIPLLIGFKKLYPWADPDLVAKDPVLQHRHPFFNPVAVAIRTLLCLLLWTALAFMLRRLSVRRDDPALPPYENNGRGPSALGLVLYFFTMTSCSIDWIMSRQGHWYSSVFGMVMVIGQSLAGLVFCLVILWSLSSRPPIQAAIRPKPLNDLGNMVLMFVILWAYTNFAQLLVQWMGNTQEDVTFYYQRIQGGWKWLSIGLIVLHFFVPFFLLLRQENKRRIEILGGLSLALLALRLVDLLYLTIPTSQGDQPNGMSWLDLVVPIGICGVWMAFFYWNLDRAPLLPLAFAEEAADNLHGTTGTITAG